MPLAAYEYHPWSRRFACGFLAERTESDPDKFAWNILLCMRWTES